MKRILSLFILVTIIFTLVACGDNDKQDETKSQQKQSDLESNKKTDQEVDQKNDEVKKNETNEETNEDDPYKYSSDTEYSIDLNKDGQPDTIIYSNNEDVLAMTINGNLYELNAHDPYMTYNKFRVVDIDPSDNSVEIVLSEAYPPMEDCLTFYRYDGKNFHNIGNVLIGCLNEKQNEISIDGNGKFNVAMNSNIMQDGVYYKEYIIGKTGNIEALPQQGLCSYTTPITSKVNETIRAYNDKTTEQSYVEIAAGEEIVIYGEIDNWLNIKWKDKELWINGEELVHFSSDPDFKFQFDGIKFWS